MGKDTCGKGHKDTSANFATKTVKDRKLQILEHVVDIRD